MTTLKTRFQIPESGFVVGAAEDEGAELGVDVSDIDWSYIWNTRLKQGWKIQLKICVENTTQKQLVSRMPELPEVEVVKRGLQKVFSAKPLLQEIQIYRKDLRFPIPKKQLQGFVGAVFLGVERRAKYLVLKTDRGDLLSHLGMSGAWRIEAVRTEKNHDHIRLVLSNGVQLVYNDPRRFGLFEVLDAKNLKRRFGHLGFEPFDSELTAEVLKKALAATATTVKVALMNQQLIVGVGNIYASEILFRSRVSPLRKSSRVKLAECIEILQQTRAVLDQAIRLGGSSIDSFHDTQGSAGDFQNQHLVYDRKGQPCSVCQTEIRAKTIGGRSTYWCPRCQR